MYFIKEMKKRRRLSKVRVCKGFSKISNRERLDHLPESSKDRFNGKPADMEKYKQY